MSERVNSSPIPPAVKEAVSANIAKLEQVKDQTFDYVIIGGGTSGLVLAASLTEDPKKTVAVLELGNEMHEKDVAVHPARYGHAFAPEHKDIHFMHLTTPQTHANSRVLPLFRGKGVGGSSSINFFAWMPPPKFDIDAWERLGAEGWNFENFHQSIKKAENFIEPSEKARNAGGLIYDSSTHGKGGPITTSLPKYYPAGEKAIFETWANMGISPAKDYYGGDITGYANAVSTIKPDTLTRSATADGYFLPNAKRPNLKLLTGATARKVLFKNGTTPLVATGVEFSHSGDTYTVHARKEVIICASSLLSASLLELSGIGNPSILKKHNIPVLIDNSNVGENIQEHMFFQAVFELDPSKGPFESFNWDNEDWVKKTFGLYQNKNVADWGEAGMLSTAFSHAAFLPLQFISKRSAQLIAQIESRVEREIASGKLPAGRAEQYKIQLEALKDPNLSDSEFFYGPGLRDNAEYDVDSKTGRVFGSFANSLNHPFSRGSVHISSGNEGEAKVDVDLNVYNYEIDMELMVEMANWLRELIKAEPLKGLLLNNPERMPGPQFFDKDPETNNAKLREYVKKESVSTYHTFGGCCCLPEDKGGVVDPSLRVYGTKNLRVGDLSIAPLHSAHHVQTIAYWVGDRLGEILKAE